MKYGLEFAGRRSVKRRLGCWLWVIVAAIVLALVVAARAGETLRGGEEETLRRGDLGSHSLMVSPSPCLDLAGFGVPDWVAFGVVMTLVLAVLGRLAWGWCVERDERSTYGEETWGEEVLPTLPPAPTPTHAPSPFGLIPGTVLKPAKHGFILDLQDGVRRAHVRVFEFEVQEFTPGNAAEMPVSIDEPQAITRLRQGMELMRETMVKGTGLTGVTSLTDGKEGATA